MSLDGPDSPTDLGASKVTTLVTVFAIIVCMAALATSALTLVSVHRVRDDLARVLADVPTPISGTATPTSNPQQGDSTPTPTSDGSETAAPTAPVINPTSDFVPKYTDKLVTLRPNGGCNFGRELDLDEPKVDPAAGEDVSYSPRCGGSPLLTFATAKVGVVNTPDAQPSDCVSQIDLSPAAQALTVNQDLVICAITDGQGRLDDASLRKLVRVVVTAVGSDKSVTLRLTAWEVPS